MGRIEATIPDMQSRFIEEYLFDLNATAAALRAGYSQRNAGKIGSQLLGKTRIRDEIKKRIAERSIRLTINSDRILDEIVQLATANPLDIIDFSEGNLN